MLTSKDTSGCGGAGTVNYGSLRPRNRLPAWLDRRLFYVTMGDGLKIGPAWGDRVDVCAYFIERVECVKRERDPVARRGIGQAIDDGPTVVIQYPPLVGPVPAHQIEVAFLLRLSRAFVVVAAPEGDVRSVRTVVGISIPYSITAAAPRVRESPSDSIHPDGRSRCRPRDLSETPRRRSARHSVSRRSPRGTP